MRYINLHLHRDVYAKNYEHGSSCFKLQKKTKTTLVETRGKRMHASSFLFKHLAMAGISSSFF